MRRVRVTRWAAVLLTLLGTGFIAKGLWLPTKAQLAQLLLRRAWANTVEGEIQAKPWPWADTFPLARLVSAEHEADFIVLAGSSGRSLAFGPGHIAGTALPGRPGNSVISAHRDTQFRFLEWLETGDEITLELPDRSVQHYSVTDHAIVDYRAKSVLQPTDDAVLTLVTCYPFDAIVPGGPLRYVVRAVRSSPEPLGATDVAALKKTSNVRSGFSSSRLRSNR